jgi:hypothetical protein
VMRKAVVSFMVEHSYGGFRDWEGPLAGRFTQSTKGARQHEPVGPPVPSARFVKGRKDQGRFVKRHADHAAVPCAARPRGLACAISFAKAMQ